MTFRSFVKEHVEMIVSVVAVIMAGAAVVIAMVQTDVMREEVELERQHARMSVMPSAMLFYSNGTRDDGRKFFELNVVNKGLGPAIIEGFKITYKGQPMHNQLHWVETVAGGEGALVGLKADIGNSSTGAGVTVMAGDTLNPIRVSHDELAPLILEALKDTEISLCVCSFYGDCQLAENLGERPKPVNSCQTQRQDGGNRE
ncbi:MAG: hypothetical protein HWE25_09080 [Alphaproteobacteria bacterium]|nr:hypothetical protein [Alphaproteobacteria bacterium]